MKIKYIGNRNWWNENRTNKIRFAEIDLREDDEKEEELANEVFNLLIEWGYKVDWCDYTITTIVSDREDYEDFKEVYLEAKKQARKNINAPKEVKQVKKVLSDDIYNVVSANLITNNRNEDEEKAYEEVVFLTSKECLKQLEEVYKYYGDDDQIANAIYDGFTYDGEYRDLLENVICNIIFYVKDKVDKEEKEELENVNVVENYSNGHPFYQVYAYTWRNKKEKGNVVVMQGDKEKVMKWLKEKGIDINKFPVLNDGAGEAKKAPSAQSEETKEAKETPSTLNFYSRKKSIEAWEHVKCKDGVTAIRHLRKAVENSDKMPDKDKKLLLEWLGDEKRFLEILDGYEHAYAVNHGWGIDLIEEIKGLWFISVYVRKNIEQ